MKRQPSGHGHHNPFLARLRRSGTMGEADLEALDELATSLRAVDAGTGLLAEESRPARLHVLLEGWACRQELLHDGTRQITAVLLPGDVCDLDKLWINGTDGDVAALTTCTVASLEHGALRALAARRPGVARGLGWLGAVENAILAKHAVGLGRRSARGRVAHLFCELLLRLAATGRVQGQGQEQGYMLPMIQADLGDMLGLSTVHVNRVLQGLRGDKLITLQGRALVVLDWRGLCAAAEFRPDYLQLGSPDRAGRLNGAGGLNGARGPVARPAPATDAVLAQGAAGG